MKPLTEKLMHCSLSGSFGGSYTPSRRCGRIDRPTTKSEIVDVNQHVKVLELCVKAPILTIAKTVIDAKVASQVI